MTPAEWAAKAVEWADIGKAALTAAVAALASGLVTWALDELKLRIRREKS